jgi:anti-sigma B factor antagonist
MRADPKGTQDTPADRPAAVRSFASWLRALKLRAGDPSYRELERRTRRHGRPVPRSTLHDGLTGARLLSLEQALAVVAVLSGDRALEAECRQRWQAARRGLVIRPVADPEAAALDGLDTVRSVHVTRLVNDFANDFAIDEGHLGPWTVLRVTGDLDLYVTHDVKKRLDVAFERRPAPQVIVDLSRATFIDSAGLGVLVYGLKKLRLRGAILRLVVSDPDDALVRQVLRTFSITRLDSVFPTYRSLAEATAQAATGTPVAAEP